MNHFTKNCIALALGAAAILGSAPALAGKTLDAIKAKGLVTCGVSTGVSGFSAADSQGKWTGLDVDICRAIAASVLGDAEKVRWVPLSAPQRFTALQAQACHVTRVPAFTASSLWTNPS